MIFVGIGNSKRRRKSALGIGISAYSNNLNHLSTKFCCHYKSMVLYSLHTDEYKCIKNHQNKTHIMKHQFQTKNYILTRFFILSCWKNIFYIPYLKTWPWINKLVVESTALSNLNMNISYPILMIMTKVLKATCQ